MTMFLEMFRRVFVPTISQEYITSQREYAIKYGDLTTVHEAYLAKLNSVLDMAQRATLFHLDQQAIPKATNEYDLVSAVCDSIQKCNVLQARKKEVEEMIANFEHLKQCQTTLDWTGYNNLQDWATAMYDGYSSMATSLITLSLAGAALVYATIFSAVRGNIGLMVFTFPLFSIGFIIPALIQLGLSWASSPRRSIPFASQPFWRIVIGLFMGIASIAVAAAITILNFTVFELHRNSETLADTIPRVAGLIAFTFSGILVVIFLCSMTLSIAARGPKAFFLGDTYNNKQGGGQQLEEFDHRGTASHELEIRM